ncbi:MAG: DUF2202 domain-containing protein [Arthrospira sp. SH-MAG29]|nr:DUF2202 domain-containing protein [Arthrospira sp. SH-MAG29]MBS0015495.1 DUF2202 domain-containing protein [Arthrospira sp. SH-MAG29]
MSNNPEIDALKQALCEAIQDEYKACATYRLIIQKFGPIRPFVNIIEAEKRHIHALMPLFIRYNIPIPEDDWETRIIPPNSVEEACEEGVKAEIENGEMYQRLLKTTSNYWDVQNVFLNLQRASQENHLPAFKRCVTRNSQTMTTPNQKNCDGGHRHRHRRGCQFS